MPSVFKSYNKRNFVDLAGGGRAERSKCVLELPTITDAEGREVVLANNRAYLRMPDGSLRKCQLKRPEPKPEMVKLERPTKDVDNITSG